MKAVVTLVIKDKEGLPVTRSYEHVSETVVMAGGVYVMSNADGNPIAHIPLGMVVDIVFPDSDTNISIIDGKIKLA